MMVVMDDGDCVEDVNKDDDDVGDSYNTTNISLNWMTFFFIRKESNE